MAAASTELTLYKIEDDLLALMETEELVQPEEHEAFQNELAHQLQTAIEKRDRVGQFLRFLELQCDNCDTEIRRLQDRKQRYRNAVTRMRSYVQHTIEQMGQDDKGKWRKLEGSTVTFSLRNKPPSLEIWDEVQIPWEYQDITVTIPVPDWQTIKDFTALPDLIVKAVEAKAKYCPNKQRIKDAIDRGEEVLGADLQIGFALVVR